MNEKLIYLAVDANGAGVKRRPPLAAKGTGKPVRPATV